MQQQLKKTLLHKQKNTIGAFYTELPNEDFKSVLKKSKQLNNYIEKLDKKFDYVNWKQNLILTYNYEPLTSIIKKTEQSKKQHMKKIEAQQEINKRVYNTQKIELQLNTYKEFSQKLVNKLNQFKSKIQQYQIKKNIYIEQLNDKKNTLKQILDENYKLNTQLLKNRGILNKTDIINNLKQKNHSMKKLQKEPSKTFNVTSHKKSIIEVSAPTIKSNQFLYQDCLELLIKNVKSMNSSEDIQQGIFLEIMSKEKSKSTMNIKTNKLNSKTSMIYDILMNSYQQKMKKKNQIDFNIEWETFKKFNWRQMIGVLLMKQPNCQSLKNLPKIWD